MAKLKRRFSDISCSKNTTVRKSRRRKLTVRESRRRKLTVRERKLEIFGEDIYTEILLRLPVKSVVKFKTVSKFWLSIISSRRFRKSHASLQHRSERRLLFNFSQYIYGDLRIDLRPEITYFEHEYETMSINCISSCNGLQLLYSPSWFSMDPTYESHDQIYLVYNPTTEEYKPLLDIPLQISQKRLLCASLAFDPYESPDYKVIFMWRQRDSSKNFQLEVYSSTTGTCKVPVDNTYVGNLNYDENCGIFCNAAIHWLSANADLIVYFNVRTESINQLQTPPLGRKVQYFGQSQGHLLLVYSGEEDLYESSGLDVYELKTDYSGWFLKYQVELASIASALPQHVYPRKDRGTFMSIFLDEENDDNSTMVLLTCNEWVEYNFKKKTTKRICEFVLPQLCDSCYPWSYGFNTHQFIPTLTCL